MCVFFFKQKTAYEMRISDWSSDVCSSDLEIGSIEPGKLADLVVWTPAFFGTKPDLVIKGGMIVHAMMGDPNASIPTPQPVHARPMFASYGRAIGASRSEEPTSELQSLMRISYAVFCLKKKNTQ